MQDFYARSRLILLTRYPEAGKTKTRLIPHLGAEPAARLQQQMTEHIVAEIQQFQSCYAASLEVHFAGSSRAQMATWLGNHLRYRPQPSGGLGTRLSQAFCQGFRDGMDRVVAIGADCPQITVHLLTQAFQRLRNHDLVLGPALDGGYYLIGLSKTCDAAHAALFQGIDWGTAQVFDQTVAIAHRQALTLATLAPLSDIDRPEDLAIWQNRIKISSESKSQATSGTSG
ncbi:TIGR04282 family arsenosugar biosynthesis glycosyltransferase [Romeria aff. gracilis LEGE 07310]|uniref:TIGR04282 family arsenosugar biosynthesis glycosyltransferase n=1 Tax=Vasconcelosia minhoensis LEGE 07310 TaxID=915328 RepID=A0A8J7DCS8_9CYAN|nr:TIGR04282 family arsenosugar biosynthesis glycosyltransferase [Romeria gracilis]MBE9079207.1 TIGR04282 family arsenosugar biosynthesis glycosyltransferase [Romeria aff. gracilis LEGE 07310]